MLFVVLNVTIAIILEGYEQSQTEREETEKGDLSDLCTYSIFTQIYRGATRRLQYIKPLYHAVFRRMLSRWAWKRLEECYEKQEVLLMLRGLESYDSIDFYDFERHVDLHFRETDKEGHVESAALVDLITSQNAWVPEAVMNARNLATGPDCACSRCIECVLYL